MYQGELKKYDPAELSAYFKGAERLYWWIRDDIENLKKRKVSLDQLLKLMEFSYFYWSSIQINFGLQEDYDFEEDYSELED